MTTDPQKSASIIKALAERQGFDLVGITSADPLPQDHQRLCRAVRDGHTADMAFLRRDPSARADPKALAPWARTIICLGLSYHYLPLDAQPLVARYALGRDYHLVLKEKIQLLAEQLHAQFGRDFRSRFAVDTLPIMEKPLAQRAGLGWQGRNTLIISERFGSWILLAELITDLELPPDVPEEDRCGQCRACVDACPTGALSETGRLDARKCLSYLTIEHKEDFSPQVAKKSQSRDIQIGQCVYGCDICQQVCPFNRHTPTAREDQLCPRPELLKLSLNDLVSITEPEFKRLFAQTTVSRLSFSRFRRNIHFVGLAVSCADPADQSLTPSRKKTPKRT